MESPNFENDSIPTEAARRNTCQMDGVLKRYNINGYQGAFTKEITSTKPDQFAQSRQLQYEKANLGCKQIKIDTK